MESLSLLTVLNPKMGHHHGGKFKQGVNDLVAQDRRERLAEYHKMTNERRKQINAKVQKRREKEQLDTEAQEAEERK